MQPEKIDPKTLKLNLLEKKRVIVRVWTSGVNLQKEGDNVGHVSVEADDRYMSLWPKQAHNPFETSAKESEGKGISKPIAKEFALNYEIERDHYEGREPEFTFCFYTLDIDDIKQRFQVLEKSLQGWCLFGGLCENAESCVSMAWELLVAGGIQHLVTSIEQSSVSAKESGFAALFSSKQAVKSKPVASAKGSVYASENIIQMLIKSPDAIVPLLQQAKRNELVKSPQTRDIAFKGEWQETSKPVFKPIIK